MSTLGRAFTTRRAKQSPQISDSTPQRSNTTKGFGSIRNKISGPVELVHTTNMLSYNAPDIFPNQPKSATSSRLSSKSSDDDLSDNAPTAASSPPTSPDIPSAPKRDMMPEPNHLSSYFAVSVDEKPPAIPKRAPSHTSRGSNSYGNLNRQRSTSQMSEQSQRTLASKSSMTFSRSSSTSTSTSTSSHAGHAAKLSNTSITLSHPRVPSGTLRTAQSQPQLQQHRKDYSQSHPFGKELAQVSEIAEEFGVTDRLNVADSEEKELQELGLCKFSADDYLGELQGLYDSIFGLTPRPLKTPVHAPRQQQQELWI